MRNKKQRDARKHVSTT